MKDLADLVSGLMTGLVIFQFDFMFFSQISPNGYF